MILILALLPATMLTVAGYVVFYVSGRSEGSFKAFGKYLGFWAFTLAGLVVLGGVVGAARHHGMRGHFAEYQMMRGRPPAGQRWAPPVQDAPPAAPSTNGAAPATPAPK